MAFIRKRGKKYSVVYKVKGEDGKVRQKSESFDTHKEANTRMKEIEYKTAIGKFEVSKCTRLDELLQEYIRIYGRDKWGVSTYGGNISVINNYIIPTIGNTSLNKIDTHFLEKYYQKLLDMPAVSSSRNQCSDKKISTATVNEIHKILRSCFRQAKKWNMMDKNPAEDATVPKHKKEKREIWTADMLMQAINACDNKWLKVAFHLSFTATLRLGELLGLTWDCVDISEDAIKQNRAYIMINKQVERVSQKAVEDLNSKEIILVFHRLRKITRRLECLKHQRRKPVIEKYIFRSQLLFV